METIASLDDSERSFEAVSRDPGIVLHGDHTRDPEIITGILGLQY